jgi:diguanylate cyclase (GGDEF)-like protein
MKAYLEAMRDSIGLFGSGYRGRGDEAIAVIVGQGHDQAVEFAETIGKRVAALRCEHKGHALPGVTASIGVASAPPEPRTMDLENLADARKRRAKEGGKNRVIAS